jgi:hypothetical protein
MHKVSFDILKKSEPPWLPNIQHMDLIKKNVDKHNSSCTVHAPSLSIIIASVQFDVLWGASKRMRFTGI